MGGAPPFDIMRRGTQPKIVRSERIGRTETASTVHFLRAIVGRYLGKANSQCQAKPNNSFLL